MTKSRGRKSLATTTRRSRRNNRTRGPKNYYEKVSQKKSINRWTENEYLQLVALVRDYGENWEKISDQFTNKTAKQCMQKFKNSARSAKKGNWTESEDKILMEWIRQHGPNKWTECSKNIRGRCGKQCRERWVNILNPGVKKGNWVETEQRQIFESLKKYFTSWSLMAKELEGRTENSIKNYFYSSVRRLKSNNIINYLKLVYGDAPLVEGSLTEREYSVCLKSKLPLLLQSKEKLLAEISKLNVLSKLICNFLLDMDQLDRIVASSGLDAWRHRDDEASRDFLKFLVEIVLELNGNGGRSKGKKGSRSNLSKKSREKFFNLFLILRNFIWGQ